MSEGRGTCSMGGCCPFPLPFFIKCRKYLRTCLSGLFLLGFELVATSVVGGNAALFQKCRLARHQVVGGRRGEHAGLEAGRVLDGAELREAGVGRAGLVHLVAREHHPGCAPGAGAPDDAHAAPRRGHRLPGAEGHVEEKEEWGGVRTEFNEGTQSLAGTCPTRGGG